MSPYLKQENEDNSHDHFSCARVPIVCSLWCHQELIVMSSAERKPSMRHGDDHHLNIICELVMSRKKCEDICTLMTNCLCAHSSVILGPDSIQAVPINGDNIPPLWSVPTPSRNTQQIVLFLSHCGSYTGENHSRKICLRRISAWLCPLECHGMEGIEAAFDTKSLGNVKKVFAKSCGNPIFGQFLATRGPKMRARTRKSIGVQRLTP